MGRFLKIEVVLKQKTILLKIKRMVFKKVPTTGFEPAHLLAPPPQDGMSTNFTTWAINR